VNQRPALRINLAARAATAEARRTRTRERLLDAAESVIADKGFQAASIEDFVGAAGVSRGTFYNYFPTTTALLHALNIRVAGDLDRQLDRMDTAIEDPVARLAAALHTVAAAYQSNPVRGWVALQLAASNVPRAHAFEDRFANIYREAVALGRFRPIDITSAWTLSFGAMRMAQRDLVSGVAAPPQTIEVVALILTAFGVPYEDAERISCTEAVAARAVQTAAV
jgi:AcrR family transcriptional regulator